MAKWIIHALKYFDKINGNTYHSVNIIDIKTNESILKARFVYGYGEQYKQTAYDLLVHAGLRKEEDRYNHNLNREDFIFICNDVNTQRELKNI